MSTRSSAKFSSLSLLWSSKNEGMAQPPTQSQADDLTERLVQTLASLPDERLAEVTARYSRKTGKLTVIDNDTGERLVLDVESGGKPTGDPIPAGEYEILEQRRTGQYRLDALDSSPRNDAHEPTGRTSFRLHGPGRTIGCIACKDPSSWRKVKLLIDRTSTSMVKDNATPWWKRIFGTRENIRKFGRLIVE